MKKTLFLLATLACANFANAQFNVYEHNFNTNGVEGWTLVDHDGNNLNWSIVNNSYSMFGGESFNVLGLSDMEVSGTQVNNWAVLPVQDMSFYNGVKLQFTYLKGFFELWADNSNVFVYAYASPSGVPTIADFLTQEPIANPTLSGDQSDPIVHVEVSVDVPAQYNVADVYFAIVYKAQDGTGNGYVLELTNVTLTAQEISGTDTFTEKKTILKQNPVAEKLELQLSPKVNPELTNVQVYNLNGMLVKDAHYGTSGINVEDLASGTYLLVLNDGATKEQLKFIKK